MFKLIVMPLVLLGLVLVYVQFEVPILRFAVDNIDDGVLASMAMSRLASHGQKALIVGRLQSPSSRARLFAMRFLGDQQDAELWTYLPSLCVDPDDEVARDAVTYSGKMKVKDSIPAIIKHYEQNKTRKTTAQLAWVARSLQSLAAMGEPVPAALEVMKDNTSDRDSGAAIKQSFIDMKTRRLLPEYRGVVKSGDKLLPEAIDVLVELQGDKEASFFEECLHSRKGWVRGKAAEALAKAKAVKSLAAIQQALGRERDGDAKKLMQQAVTDLTKLTQ